MNVTGCGGKVIISERESYYGRWRNNVRRKRRGRVFAQSRSDASVLSVARLSVQRSSVWDNNDD